MAAALAGGLAPESTRRGLCGADYHKGTAMRARRSHLIVVALATLGVQLASPVVGAIGLCCAADARTAESGVAACVMHTADTDVANAPTGHDHHSGAQAPTATADDVTRMTCDCARSGHLAIGAPGLLPSPPALAAADVLVGLADERGRRPIGRLPSPTSPPPRPHAS